MIVKGNKRSLTHSGQTSGNSVNFHATLCVK